MAHLHAEYLVKLEFLPSLKLRQAGMKARYEVFVNDSGNRGVDFINKPLTKERLGKL